MREQLARCYTKRNLYMQGINYKNAFIQHYVFQTYIAMMMVFVCVYKISLGNKIQYRTRDERCEIVFIQIGTRRQQTREKKYTKVF